MSSSQDSSSRGGSRSGRTMSVDVSCWRCRGSSQGSSSKRGGGSSSGRTTRMPNMKGESTATAVRGNTFATWDPFQI